MATKKKPVPWEWLRKETARIERRDARAKRKAEAAKQLTLEPVDSAPMQALTNERGGVWGAGQPLVLMRGAKR